MRGNDIGGIAVRAAARVMAQSQSSEVLVSRVVTDLVAGAGLKFLERGSHELKELPGRWDYLLLGQNRRPTSITATHQPRLAAEQPQG
jgi:class 3 adenylate cyclase